ncbi:DUF4123 domain-containing protein [Halopseudomonas pelagia]|uniref:DUF4123 domain-containing protein n=1 Tax=Halopseudomonas pelagia TaxID=553151 RepID=UPI00039F07E9|nr:DUF4123 domain-containing protein [Halopseudomonas pelagia]|tara:strand:+ start:898 stop:1635 length:738 start_codon:yes stop_codon:yes gene_type:complete
MSYQRMDQMPDLQGQLYWLAEPQKGLLETLYEHEPDPDPVQLFEDTSFAAQASQSPLLFKLSARGKLVPSLASDPQKLSGLLIATHAPRTALLDQLRGLLEARFLQGRKALLRYYDPRVASYLLPTCTGDLQARWLGPISEITWYGGTWADEAGGSEQWHRLTQVQQAEAKASSAPLSLNETQLQRLVDQGYEHFAWRWLASHKGYEMTQVLDWIKAGMAAGHTEQKSLNAWLDSQTMVQGEQHG